MNNIKRANTIIYTTLYFVFSVMVVSALVLLLFSGLDLAKNSGEAARIDDWKYGSGAADSQRFFGSTKSVGANLNSLSFGSYSNAVTESASLGAPLMESDNIGLSVGGAKDVNNFRENIKNDYLPIASDISYEGLFYDYYFDTGESGKCKELFCPSYSYAVSSDPISGEQDEYLSVGLNSGLKEQDFLRKKLNLVVVLDISGSMGSAFNDYYYDRYGRKIVSGAEDFETKSKMQIANESLVSLLGHLNDDDSFGMVLFDDQAYLAKPIRRVEATDMSKIKKHILEITDKGGTQMSAGMRLAGEMLDEYQGADEREYENRIIFLTDAMPNLGDTTRDGLFGMVKENADNKIYTTFIGIGVDFNTELISEITKTRGANYYSVHSSDEFKTRLDDEFEFMVTPLVFDLVLRLDSDGYDIQKVYGSPESDEASGEIMRVNTLFPSRRQDGENRGGLILLKLIRRSADAKLKLSVSYEDRMGSERKIVEQINIDNKVEYYANSGIRKGILLSRYVDLLKNWIIDVRYANTVDTPFRPFVDELRGIEAPETYVRELGQWERQSMPLSVPSEYRDLFGRFGQYFANEEDIIGDRSLDKELSVIAELSQTSGLISDNGSELYSIGELLEEPVFDTEISVRGIVQKLHEFENPSFELSDGNEKLKVWYSLMVADDGTERASVDISSLRNQDQVLVKGYLKPGGKYHSRLDFWAADIEVVGGDTVLFTTFSKCQNACTADGYVVGECLRPSESRIDQDAIGICELDYSAECDGNSDCNCYCSNQATATSSQTSL